MRLYIDNITVDETTDTVGITSPLPRYSWIPRCRGNLLQQSAYRIKLTDENGMTVWNSGVVLSDECFNIQHGGTPLSPDSDYTLYLTVYFGDEPEKNKITATKKIRTGFFENTLPDASWISGRCCSPLIRKTFFSDKRIKYATAYISARGFYELYINGEKIGDRVLAPSPLPGGSVADSYDITAALTPDNNTVGIWLAPSFKARTFNKQGWCYSGSERVWCVISLVFDDGTRKLITTDESWIFKPSPITKCSIYGGEVYDNRRDITAWCGSYTDTAEWLPVNLCNDKQPRQMPTVAINELKTKKCTKYGVRENETTFCDFGENTLGYIRIKVIGEAGTKVVITHSENKTENGDINPFTNGSAANTDCFILNGNGVEIHKPRFSYRCFRYAEIRMEGVAQLVSAEKITIGTANDNGSSFICDDIMLQRMYDNAANTIRINTGHYFSDCAVRDTRTPAPEAALTADALSFSIKDMRLYFKQWLQNLADGKSLQSSDPTASGEFITALWALIENYADCDTARLHFKKAEQLLAAYEKEYNATAFANCRGDWCSPKANPKNLPDKCSSLSEFTGLCLFIHLLKTAAKIAKTIEKHERAEIYSEKAEHYTEKLYDAFYLKPMGRRYGSFCGGEQTANLAVLALNIAKPDDKKQIYSALKRQIKSVDKYHLNTGTFGTQFLVSVLSHDDEGAELLHRILHSTDYPSFGEQLLDYDATSLCEQWFGLQGQMCCCHPSFAAMFADFYRVFGGITNGGDCYKHIKIAPHMPRSVNRLNCTLSTVRGDIRVYLRRFGNEVQSDIVIPSGCDAEVTMPHGETLFLKSGEYTYTNLLKLIREE